MNCSLPCASLGSFGKFEISASGFGTVDMHRRFCVSAFEFLTMVTEGVVHGVHKVVIWSSFSVIQQRFATCSYKRYRR